MDKRKKCILAIDVGGTFFKSALVTEEGHVIDESLLSEPANSAGPAEGIKNCYQNILRKQYSFAMENSCEVIGIGIDTPGPFDCVNCVSKMKHKFQAIYDIPLKPWITEIAGDTPILFISDSSAFVIGESWQGAAKEYDNIAGVMLGTGLGIACMSQRTVLLSEAGGPAIVIYNKPFLGKTAEDYVSRRGIIRRYFEIVPSADKDIDVVDIAKLAKEGSEPAADTFEETGRLLGEILKPELIRLNTSCLVLGGQISRSFSLFEASLRSSLEDVKSLQKVAVSPNISYGHMLGCTGAVLSKFYDRDIAGFGVYPLR